LPDDVVNGADATFYGGITVPATADAMTVIWGRDGKRYVAVDKSGKPIEFGSKLPSSLHAPTNRVTFTLYQFKGTLGGEVDTFVFGKATGIRLESVRSVVMVEGCAFDGRLVGTWTGTVTEHLEQVQHWGPISHAYDENKPIPIHLTLGSMKKWTTLQEYDGPDHMSDAQTYMLEGTIDNFSEDVTVNGRTYPSLKAMGVKNPFPGAEDGKVALYRTGNMHGLSDDSHWVFQYPDKSQDLSVTGMTNVLTALTAPSMLLGSDAKVPDLQTIEIKPHIPFSTNGNIITLTPENVGAGLAQCH
jgi:hypothetical protein